MSVRLGRGHVGPCRTAAGALRLSQAWSMRFDNDATPPPPSPSTAPRESTTASADGATSSREAQAAAGPPRVSYHALPSSMYPKTVSASFTPFPLPKHDASMGFGPVRLRNVPDIESAQVRMAAATSRSPRTATMTATTATTTTTTAPAEATDASLEDAYAVSALWAELSGEDAVVGDPRRLAEAPVPAAPPRLSDAPAADLGGYHVRAHFPLLDVLECDRSVDDLLAQFWNRPEREARTATVLDLAATLQRRSNDELARILYELSSLFAWDGNGLRFIVTKVVKLGRSYAVSSELTKAFVHLVEAMTVTFVEAQPQRLTESPALFSQVLHFLALVKVLEPNKWFTLNPNAPQNRADYTHPRGTNRTLCTYGATGRVLLDFLEDLVVHGHDPAGEGPSRDGLPCATAGWSEDEILDVMAGFSGVAPDGKAASRVVAALLDALWTRWSTLNFALAEPKQATQLERLYMLLQVMDVQRDAVVDALVGGQLRGHDAALFRERDDTPPLTLAPALTQTRGPDFFSAVSRDRRPAVKAAALQLLRTSLAHARDGGDAARLCALVESGTELLQSLSCKRTALTFAQQEQFDLIAMQSAPHLLGVAERLAEQGGEALFFPLTSTAGGLPDTAALLAHLGAHPAPYVVTSNGRRRHPVRTFATHLSFVAAVDNVFLLHSSGVAAGVDRLVAAARRLRSGKDALIVTASCLRALQAAAQHGVSEKGRASADRALVILAHELEAGRAVLVPVTEELYLHDAGTYCDEDLMLWTIAAYLARDVPLVKVHTIMSTRSSARSPQHTLRGEHTPMTSSGDLYNASAPLLWAMRSKELRAVTHHAVGPRPVRDRPQTLYNVSPVRARFVYRRDKALFDRYHVTARHLAPGFSQGALNSDLRGLGFYTPDHPQVPYTAVEALKCRPVQDDPRAHLSKATS